MKIKLLIISITIALYLSAAPALAGPNGVVYSGGSALLTQEPGYFSGGGGEFTISDDDPDSLLLSNASYHVDAKGVTGSESFQTFCVERYQSLISPSDVWVSTASYLTPTIDGSGSHAYTGGPPGTLGDDLNPRTAYLYTQFALGILSDYDYDNSGVGRNVSAGQLQNVIWFIEDENVTLSSTQEQDWYDEADDALDTGGVWENMGIGDVRVLQMTSGSTDLAQDQLYYIPVPAAVILGILGLSVAGIKLRKFA